METNVVNRLKSIALFSDFRNNDAILSKLAGILRLDTYSKHDYIINEGEMGEEMFILNRGSVKVEKKTPADDKFTVANLNDKMNVLFGELALIDSDQRSASVIAVSETEVFVLKKRDFEELCEKNPEIGYHIMRQLARSLSAKFRKSSKDNINLIEALISDD